MNAIDTEIHLPQLSANFDRDEQQLVACMFQIVLKTSSDRLDATVPNAHVSSLRAEPAAGFAVYTHTRAPHHHTRTGTGGDTLPPRVRTGMSPSGITNPGDHHDPQALN